HKGLRGIGDRIAGGLSAAQPVAEAAIVLELITIPGVGEAVLVIGAGVALWTLGNLVYDERKAIEKAFKTSGTFIVQTAANTGKIVEANPALLLGPEGELGKLAWDNRRAIGAVAADAVHLGEHVGAEML